MAREQIDRRLVHGELVLLVYPCVCVHMDMCFCGCVWHYFVYVQHKARLVVATHQQNAALLRMNALDRKIRHPRLCAYLVDIKVQASGLFVCLRFFSPAITVQPSDSFDRSPCQRVLLVYGVHFEEEHATSHTKSSDVASARLSQD
jgi:hypothetical protein